MGYCECKFSNLNVNSLSIGLNTLSVDLGVELAELGLIGVVVGNKDVEEFILW